MRLLPRRARARARDHARGVSYNLCLDLDGAGPLESGAGVVFGRSRFASEHKAGLQDQKLAAVFLGFGGLIGLAGLSRVSIGLFCFSVVFFLSLRSYLVQLLLPEGFSLQASGFSMACSP